MGMAADSLLKEHAGWSLPWSASITIAIIVAVQLLLDLPHEWTLITYPALVAAISLSDRQRSPSVLSNPMVQSAADLTYGVFLLHSFIGMALPTIVRTLGISSITAIIAVLILAGFTTFALAAAANRLFEVPMRKWLAPGNSRTHPANWRVLSLGQVEFSSFGAVFVFACIAGSLEMMLR